MTIEEGGKVVGLSIDDRIEGVGRVVGLSIVEIQAQHRPDRLKKPRTESVRDRLVRLRTESVGTDRIRRFCAENRDDAMTRRKIFREEYILGLV